MMTTAGKETLLEKISELFTTLTVLSKAIN